MTAPMEPAPDMSASVPPQRHPLPATAGTPSAGPAPVSDTPAVPAPGTVTTVGSASGPGPAAEDADPLAHRDPYAVADAFGTEALLRCWVREKGFGRPDGAVLRLPLAASG